MDSEISPNTAPDILAASGNRAYRKMIQPLLNCQRPRHLRGHRFAPQLVPKSSSRLGGVDEMIISLYAISLPATPSMLIWRQKDSHVSADPCPSLLDSVQHRR